MRRLSIRQSLIMCKICVHFFQMPSIFIHMHILKEYTRAHKLDFVVLRFQRIFHGSLRKCLTKNIFANRRIAHNIITNGGVLIVYIIYSIHLHLILAIILRQMLSYRTKLYRTPVLHTFYTRGFTNEPYKSVCVCKFVCVHNTYVYTQEYTMKYCKILLLKILIHIISNIYYMHEDKKNVKCASETEWKSKASASVCYFVVWSKKNSFTMKKNTKWIILINLYYY